MEESTGENARTDGLKRLHEMVTKVLLLLEQCGGVSREEREHILAERNLQVLEGWYKDAIAKNEQYLTAMAKRETLFLLLADFGQMPEALKAKILSDADTETLNLWIQAARRTESIAQFSALRFLHFFH